MKVDDPDFDNYFCSMNTAQTTAAPAKPKLFRTPLAITGFIFLFIGALIATLMLILKAEPSHNFYAFAGTGLGFLVINPLIVRSRYSLLWQGLLIGSAVTSFIWMFLL